MTTVLLKPKRSKRFIRPSKAELGSFELLPKYETVLEYLLFHRLLTSEHIEKLTEYSTDHTRRILQQLWRHGYVDRVKRQNRFDLFAYALGVEGIKHLKRKGLYDGRNNFTDRNRNLTKDFVEHDLLTSDFMVRLALSCRRHNARIIYFPEILATLAPPSTSQLSRPYQWRVRLSFEGKTTSFLVTPDFPIFGIELFNTQGERSRAFFALETDMSTEPVFPSDFTKRSNLFKKLLAYRETDKESTHTQLYGIKNIRALFIIRSRKEIWSDPEARINNIIESAQRLFHNRRIFLFITDKELERCDDLLTLPWRNHRDDKRISLISS